MADETSLNLVFNLEKDGKELSAHYSTGTEASACDLARLRQHILQQGFEAGIIHENQMLALLKSIRANQNWAGVLAEKRDATVLVEIDPQELRATAVVTSPVGGKHLDKEAIYAALSTAKIQYGINDKAIAQIIQGMATTTPGQTVRTLIAQGKPSCRGRDATIEALLTDASDRRPQILEDGSVDYRNFGKIMTVPAGTPLIRKIPATLGTAGSTVTGKPILATVGTDIKLKIHEGVIADSQNPNILMAAVAGIPVILPDGAKIDQVLNFANINVTTGNIDFDGTLVIKGDIISGMVVKVSGDIIVHGTIESAHVETGGKLEVAGGIIGHRHAQQTGSPQFAAVIRCGTTLSARFIENAQVETNDSIYVQEAISHCRIISKNQIYVGIQRGGRGQILGGNIIAYSLIHAKLIGSPAYAPTLIEVGYNEAIKHKITILSDLEKEKERLIEDVNRNLIFLSNHPKADNQIKFVELQTGLTLHQKGLAEILQQKNALYEELRQVLNAKIICEKQVYASVKIQIANLVHFVKENLPSGIFELIEGTIKFSPGPPPRSKK